MTKTASQLMRALGVSLLLSACGTDRQARVDEAASQLLSERLGTATIAASATVAPTAAIAATSLPVATVATVAQATASPQAPTAVAVPWAAKLKRIPGSNDPDGFDYEAPPEVVEAIVAFEEQKNEALLSRDTPGKARDRGGIPFLQQWFGDPLLTRIGAEVDERRAGGFAIQVLRERNVSNVLVLGITIDGYRAKVRARVTGIKLDNYYPDTLIFYNSTTLPDFTMTFVVQYDPKLKRWLHVETLI
jgi:hypothetical protein